MEIGLDGICVTDHQFIWGAEEAQRLGQKYGYPVYRGVEVHTTLGDILVFGVYRDFPKGMDAVALCHLVAEAGGVAVLAHPYRSGTLWSLNWEDRQEARRMTEKLHEMVGCGGLRAIEVCNGSDGLHAAPEAYRLAGSLGLPGVGASDAHRSDAVGLCATRFEDRISTELELIEALREGSFEPVVLRNGIYKPLNALVSRPAFRSRL